MVYDVKPAENRDFSWPYSEILLFWFPKKQIPHNMLSTELQTGNYFSKLM